VCGVCGVCVCVVCVCVCGVGGVCGVCVCVLCLWCLCVCVCGVCVCVCSCISEDVFMNLLVIYVKTGLNFVFGGHPKSQAFNFLESAIMKWWNGKLRKWELQQSHLI